MSDDKNIPINPYDSWPEAEKMLDSHFKAKKNRRVLFILLLLLFGGTTLLQNYNNKKEVKTISKNSTITKSILNKKTNTPISKTENPINEKTKVSSIDQRKLISSNDFSLNVESLIKSNKTNKSSSKKTTSLFKANNSSNKIIANRTIIEGPLTKEGTFYKVESNNSEVDNSLNLKEVEVSTVITATPLITSFNLSRNFNDSISKFKLESSRKKSRLELLVYGGFLNINNTLSGNSTVEYIERRNREESQIILPNFGASISKGNGKWDFRAGIELSMLGEKVNYSPYSNGDYYKTSEGWQPYQHLVTDSDSTFIFGILFINTSLKLVNDSTYTTKIDTLNGPHYDEKILHANGVNKSYYLEFPLEVSYTHFINRWGFGVSAGISPSMLLSINGYYLTTDQKTTKSLDKETSTKMFLNGRLNLEFSYVVNERLRLMVRPSYRKNLTKVKDGSGTNHQYSSYGLNIGALFKIR